MPSASTRHSTTGSSLRMVESRSACALRACSARGEPVTSTPMPHRVQPGTGRRSERSDHRTLRVVPSFAVNVHSPSLPPCTTARARSRETPSGHSRSNASTRPRSSAAGWPVTRSLPAFHATSRSSSSNAASITGRRVSRSRKRGSSRVVVASRTSRPVRTLSAPERGRTSARRTSGARASARRRTSCSCPNDRPSGSGSSNSPALRPTSVCGAGPSSGARRSSWTARTTPCGSTSSNADAGSITTPSRPAA